MMKQKPVCGAICRSLSGARIVSMEQTLILTSSHMLHINVQKDTGHILVIGSVLMGENDNDKERGVSGT